MNRHNIAVALKIITQFIASSYQGKHSVFMGHKFQENVSDHENDGSLSLNTAKFLGHFEEKI